MASTAGVKATAQRAFYNVGYFPDLKEGKGCRHFWGCRLRGCEVVTLEDGRKVLVWTYLAQTSTDSKNYGNDALPHLLAEHDQNWAQKLAKGDGGNVMAAFIDQQGQKDALEATIKLLATTPLS